MTTMDGTVQVPHRLRAPFRLERAELLKLRKSRGVLIPLALLTVGAIIVMYTALELFHLPTRPSTARPGARISSKSRLRCWARSAG